MFCCSSTVITVDPSGAAAKYLILYKELNGRVECRFLSNWYIFSLVFVGEISLSSTKAKDFEVNGLDNMCVSLY